MRTLSATDVARNFSKLLDALEHGGEEVVVIRNRHPVARLVPGTARMTALEAMADIHRVLDDDEGAAWLEDAKGVDRQLKKEARDPWE